MIFDASVHTEAFILNALADPPIKRFSWGHPVQCPPSQTAQEPWHTSSPNSTWEGLPDKKVMQQVKLLFESAREMTFEDGMESDFSHDLEKLVREHQRAALVEVVDQICFREGSDELKAEALRWLGRMPNRSTHNYRRWLLERCLLNPSARVRDGAVLGLASLGDPYSIPSLREAINRETCAELRNDMQQTLSELETMPSCHTC